MTGTFYASRERESITAEGVVQTKWDDVDKVESRYLAVNRE